MENYLIYLRKSRADQEAELRGEEETLARHERTLVELAKKMKLNVTGIYKEVVSGETIADRPQMQRLLREVRDGLWSGVLVMEIERLARGDTIDQGMVAQTFKFGQTKIITPMKTYDPEDEFDEEYFEFSLFMSRREYKTINRRIQRGRIASVKEGKYIAGAAPYGYEKVKIKGDKGFTLSIVPEEADVVRIIYDWYVNGIPQEDGSYRRLGIYLISKKLDSLHIKPMNGDKWSQSTVSDILKNPTYAGKIRWQWRKVVKKSVDGEIVGNRPKDYDCMVYDGLHEAIVPMEVFEAAQAIMRQKRNSSVQSSTVLKNPLSGLIICGKCGQLMTRAASNTKTRYDVIFCPNRYCDNVSSPLTLIEDKLVSTLKDWIGGYELEWDEDDGESYSNPSTNTKKNALKNIKKQIGQANKQLENAYDFLEQGVYTTDEFLERNRNLSGRIEELNKEYVKMEDEYKRDLEREVAKKNFIPHVNNILDVYYNLDTATSKNELLKEILEKVEYVKKEPNKKFQGDNVNFELTVFPKLPSNIY